MSDYRAQLAAIQERTGVKMRQLVQQSARVLYNEMSSGGKYSPGTPVGDPSLWKHPAPAGYVPGHARSSWNAEIGTVPAATSGEGADAAVFAVIDEMNVGDTLIMACSTPYIRTLEFDGHSQQAPDGFVRPACEAITLIVEEVARNLAGQ